MNLEEDAATQVATQPEGTKTPGDPDPPVMFVPGTEEVRYHHERVLGEGGMGIVELHRDQRIGRNVAMKILHSGLSDEGSQRRFLREAQLQGQLEHPSIVPVYDIGPRKDGSMFFTMKRVNGVTLHEIVKGHREDNPAFEKYSRRRLLSAFSQVCVAIDFAHRRGVVHRDLKPANIMLGDFGEVYVLDWGIAKVSGVHEDPSGDPPITPAPAPATQAGALLGTPGYMAPEQLSGEDVAPTADVYSLGAILFELLALEPLHKRGKLEAMIASTLSVIDARPSSRGQHLDISPELDAMYSAAFARRSS
jgi:eukaryotic-like serine/threonine-protein kinase